MNYSDSPTKSPEISINTSLTSERISAEMLLISDDLQRVANKLQYDRSLSSEEKERLSEFAKRRENEKSILEKYYKDGR